MEAVIGVAAALFIGRLVIRGFKRLPQIMQNFIALGGRLVGLFVSMFMLIVVWIDPKATHAIPDLLLCAFVGSVFMLMAGWAAVRAAMQLMIMAHHLDRSMAPPTAPEYQNYLRSLGAE